jgi:hypothetical protein
LPDLDPACRRRIASLVGLAAHARGSGPWAPGSPSPGKDTGERIAKPRHRRTLRLAPHARIARQDRVRRTGEAPPPPRRRCPTAPRYPEHRVRAPRGLIVLVARARQVFGIPSIMLTSRTPPLLSAGALQSSSSRASCSSRRCPAAPCPTKRHVRASGPRPSSPPVPGSPTPCQTPCSEPSPVSPVAPA